VRTIFSDDQLLHHGRGEMNGARLIDEGERAVMPSGC